MTLDSLEADYVTQLPSGTGHITWSFDIAANWRIYYIEADSTHMSAKESIHQKI